MSYFVTSFLNKDSAKFSISVIGALRMNWFQSCCFSSCLYICSSTLATVVNLKTNVLRVKKLLQQQKFFYATFFFVKIRNEIFFLTVSPGASGAESNWCEVEFQCRTIAARASTLAAPHQ